MRKQTLTYIGICFGLFLFLFNADAQKKKETRVGKKLLYDNTTYEPYIRSVQLYPLANSTRTAQNALTPPIINLDDVQPLLLQFDCLNQQFQNFRVKIFHCNSDWTPSPLNEIEYLSEYNDFPIQDYYASFATKIPYYHFTVSLPSVKLSGNYVVMVYKNRQEEDLVLTRRFMVYQNQVSASGQVVFPNHPLKRRTDQQINFGINYGNYPIISPKDDFKIVIRQNYRDDKILKNLKPFMVNSDARTLNFQFFDGENTIAGGNEFRMFDGRSYQQKLVNISHIVQGEQENILELYHEKTQGNLSYIDNKDFNGMYVIDNYETNKGDTEADYVRVSFQLLSDSLENKKLYINGAFNDWRLNEVNQMHYVPENHAYEAFIQLKQGIYNYQYVTVDSQGNINDKEFEGSHAQTENVYEILVYHRPLSARADALVGYTLIHSR